MRKVATETLNGVVKNGTVHISKADDKRVFAKVRVPIYKDGKETGQFREVDFKDVSDIAQTKAIGQALADLAPVQAQRELEAAQKYGTQFAQQRRAELQALDPLNGSYNDSVTQRSYHFSCAFWVLEWLPIP